ncbi:MAG TPA: hypothetical protein DEB24_08090 [Coriobacteriia bacterium]|nr:hypothetical protein [Coriobacteriia bacterium]
MGSLMSFESTHAAIEAEKRLRHLHPQVIPTPTKISAGCGISLRFPRLTVDELKAALKAPGGSADSSYTPHSY